jgi:hypothetical protein
MIKVTLKPQNPEAVPRETTPIYIKKIFPDRSKKVEPHVDEEQGVEYDKDGDTIIL